MSLEHRESERTRADARPAQEEKGAQLDERDFLREVEKLNQQNAGQLAKRWMAEYENVDDKDLDGFFARFGIFLRKREDALFSLEVPAGLDERLVEEIKQFDKNVVLSFGSAELFQGNGATAEVYETLGHPHICVKYIINQARYNENNHVRIEFGLLGAVRALRHGRVRTPTPYFLRIHPSEGHSYGMEKIDGKSLSQITEKPHEFPELVALAKRLDRDQVLQELSGFVQRMHLEKGITHNDLYERNIMLDREGVIFIIDFGKAKQYEVDGAIRDQQQESDLATLLSSVRSFFADIDKLNI